jgi:DEAD/DEAH box helicase domain-containing protein
MPEQEIQTTSWWLHFTEDFLRQFNQLSPVQKQNGLVGLGNVLRTVAAFLLMCDPRDLGLATSDEPHTQGLRIQPNLYLYDAYPGGIGLSEPLFRMTDQLLRQALQLMLQCPCQAGCPSCVGPLGEVGDDGKAVAIRFVQALTEQALASSESVPF